MSNIKAFLFSVISSLLIGCSKSEDMPAITFEGIDKDISINGLIFDFNGGTEDIQFTTNKNWIAEIEFKSNSYDWCSISPQSGNLGEITINLSVQPNQNYDEREAVLKIIAEDIYCSIPIIQKEKSTIILEKDIYEISSEGGDINIKFDTNSDFDVIVDNSSKSWISCTQSKSLQHNSITVNILESNEYKSREGFVYIKNNAETKKLTIKQFGTAILSLPYETYEADKNGDTIRFDIKSNSDVLVTMPQEDWITIHKNDTRDISNYTYEFIVKGNGTKDERNTVISFHDKDTLITKQLSIKQKPSYCYISNNIAGKLKQSLADLKLNDARTIKVSGEINAQDFKYLSELTFTSLRNIDLSESQVSQFENLFSESRFVGSLLETISLPEGLVSIENNAFSSCSSLYEVKMPNSVKGIGKRAFWECFNLSNIVLSNQLEVIDDEAFENCKKLKLNEFPNTLKKIGIQSFYSCEGITTLTIPSSVTSMGRECFFYLPNLKKLHFNDGLKSIGAYSFMQSESLTDVYIPNSVEFIGEFAFSGCLSLKNIKLPPKITSIKNGTFYACDELMSIDIPNNVNSIEEEAFLGCNKLSHIIMGTKMNKIESKAFSNCQNIKEIYCKSINPPMIENEAFDIYVKYATILYVPLNVLQQYKQAKFWRDSSNIKGFD